MLENRSVDVKNMIGNKDFFAKEFLIWLWYSSEQDQGHIKLKDEEITVFIEDKLVLEELLGDQEDLFKGGVPSESPEAKYALKSGKIIKECKIKIIKGNASLSEQQFEWIFNFKANGFNISGIKLPSVDVKDYREKLRQRMMFLEELYDYLGALYKKFLTIRLDKPIWDKELVKIKEWIEND